jgi:hypothetical protein
MTKTADNHLTPEQASALRAFAARNGRNWKSRLLTLWQNGQNWKEPEGPFLRQIRNGIGPSGLCRLPPLTKAAEAAHGRPGLKAGRSLPT